MIMSTHELAWAAGFFDGEGHAAFQKNARTVKTGGRRVYSTIILDIRQVDRRVLERFRDAVGVGRIYGPYRPSNPRARDVFMFATGSFENTQAVVAKLWRWLSPVKREQVIKMLEAKRAAPKLKPGRDPWRTPEEKRTTRLGIVRRYRERLRNLKKAMA